MHAFSEDEVEGEGQEEAKEQQEEARQEEEANGNCLQKEEMREKSLSLSSHMWLIGHFSNRWTHSL